jgi:hypothetical protein
VLFALCRGAHIVTPSYVYASIAARAWVDEQPYVSSQYSITTTSSNTNNSSSGSSSRRRAATNTNSSSGGNSSSSDNSRAQLLAGEQVYICAGGKDLPPTPVLKKLLEATGAVPCSSLRSATLGLLGSDAEQWLADATRGGGPNRCVQAFGC